MKTRLVVVLVALAAMAALLLPDMAAAQRRPRRPRRPPATEEPVEAPPEQTQQQPQGQEQQQPGTTPPGQGWPPVDPQAVPGQQPPGETQPAEGEPPPEEPAVEDEPFGSDLGPLREEFTALMDDLVQTRSRIAVLGRQLFQTKIRIVVQNRADDQTLARIAVQLDGASVFRADGSSFSGEDGEQVFEGFAAPGPHMLAIEVEQRGRADDNFRYTLRDAFRFEVLRGKLSDITVVLDDDSDMAEDFPDDEEGEYDVRTRVRVATRELGER